MLHFRTQRYFIERIFGRRWPSKRALGSSQVQKVTEAAALPGRASLRGCQPMKNGAMTSTSPGTTVTAVTSIKMPYLIMSVMDTRPEA